MQSVSPRFGFDEQTDAGLPGRAGRSRFTFPVIIGGAAINRDFGRRIALWKEVRAFFEPGVFYARDAFEGLELVDALTSDPQRRRDLVERAKGEAFAQRERRSAPHRRGHRRSPRSRPIALQFRNRRSGAFARWTESILRELWPCFDLRSLYGFRGAPRTPKARRSSGSSAKSSSLAFAATKAQAIRRRSLLGPKVVYGYFPAAGLGNDDHPLRSGAERQEVARLAFRAKPAGSI